MICARCLGSCFVLAFRVYSSALLLLLMLLFPTSTDVDSHHLNILSVQRILTTVYLQSSIVRYLGGVLLSYLLVPGLLTTSADIGHDHQ